MGDGGGNRRERRAREAEMRRRAKKQGKVPYADLAGAGVAEDDRITMIGEKAMEGQVVGVIVDDIPGKPERYIEKVLSRFPEVMLEFRGAGPTPGAYTLKFRRKGLN